MKQDKSNHSFTDHGCLLFIFDNSSLVDSLLEQKGLNRILDFSKMIPDEAKTRESIKTDPVSSSLNTR